MSRKTTRVFVVVLVAAALLLSFLAVRYLTRLAEQTARSRREAPATSHVYQRASPAAAHTTLPGAAIA